MPSEPPPHTIRRAEPRDAPVLGAMRAAQQAEIEGPQAPGVLAAYEAECSGFFARELGVPFAWVFAWLADTGRGVIGSVVLTIAPAMPRLGSPGAGPDGRIRSVYVLPGERRYGVARALLGHAIAFAEELAVTRLMLGASAMGRPLYESLGFVDNRDEMVYRSVPLSIPNRQS